MDEAKRWFEASTMICKFVPGGSERAAKVSQIVDPVVAATDVHVTRFLRHIHDCFLVLRKGPEMEL